MQLNEYWRIEDRPSGWVLINKMGHSREYQTRRALLRAIDLHKLRIPGEIMEKLNELPEKKLEFGDPE